MKPGGYDVYAELLAHLIGDVRKDLSAPKMPFVIGVMGIGGGQEGKKAPQKYFRQAQIAPVSLPEFKGSVAAVETAPFGTTIWTRCSSVGTRSTRSWIGNSRRTRV